MPGQEGIQNRQLLILKSSHLLVAGNFEAVYADVAPQTAGVRADEVVDRAVHLVGFFLGFAGPAAVVDQDAQHQQILSR